MSAHFDKSVRFWDTRSGDAPVNAVKFGAKVTSLYVTSGKAWTVIYYFF